MLGGLALACIYSAIALVMFAAAGSSPGSLNADFGNVLVTYFAGGVCGGLVVGALWPLTKTSAGLSLVGVLAAFPVVAGFGMLEFGSLSRWNSGDWWTVAVVSVLLGVVGAPRIANAFDEEKD